MRQRQPIRLLDWDGPEPDLTRPICQRVTQSQFEESIYTRWSDALGAPVDYHRKRWEHVYIMRCLEVAGMLQPGKRGLGFGVGREPLIKVMSDHRCDILATDYANPLWHDYHAQSLVDLGVDGRDNVELRQLDMRDIPESLHGQWDYVWSSCSLEHIGGLEAGLDFMRAAHKCLRPGGVAVHTTELNISSTTATLDNPDLCLYRASDVTAFCAEVGAELTLKGGQMPFDKRINTPGIEGPHINLKVGAFVTTSFGFFLTHGTQLTSRLDGDTQ